MEHDGSTTTKETFKPEYRSRLVVQEKRRTSVIPQNDVAATTSATPPLKVVGFFCRLAVSMLG